MKGYRAESAKRKARGAKSRGQQAQALESPLPVELCRTHLIPPAMLWQCVWSVVYQRGSLETPCPKFLLGSDHIGTLCLPHTQIPDSQEESKCLAYTIMFVQTFLSVRECWEPSLNPGFQIPTKGQCLQAGLSKDSNLKPAVNFFLHNFHLARASWHLCLLEVQNLGRTSKWLNFINHKDLS